jgi:putative spermidine/putrescine transport system permease protein
MLNTFKTSFIVTLACLVLGYPARLRDGATQRCRRNHPSRRGRPELLDRLRGSHLCLAGDPRNKGPVAATYALAGWGKPPQLLFTSFSSTLGMTHVLLPYMVLALYG